MVREILKIRTDNGLQDNNPAFKGIELTEYSAKFPRMGMPSLSATLMWPTPLDKQWTRKEYVVLRDEIFFIRHTPSSSKSNTDSRYRHEIEFTSEFAEILGNTYFVDAVPDADSGVECITRNKPCTNSTTFTFYGTIAEMVDRYNCALRYAGIGDSILDEKTNLTTLDEVVGDGYCVMLDPYGDYDPAKSYEFKFDDKSFWEAITYGYDTTKVPFERRARKFIFGAVPNVVQHKFEYGHDNELLSVSKKNANAKVINRITMLGSSENIPHYYPNETEYGHISIAAKSGNKVLTSGMVEIANMTQLLSRLNADSFAVLGKYDGVDVGDARVLITGYTYAFSDNAYSPYRLNGPLKHYAEPVRERTIPWHIRVHFKVKNPGMVECDDISGYTWRETNTQPASPSDFIKSIEPGMSLKRQGVLGADYTSQIEAKDGKISFGYLDKGEYIFKFTLKIANRGGNDEPIVMYCILSSVNIVGAEKQKTGYYWAVGDNRYDGVGALGVKISADITDAMVGDGFGWTASGRMPFQSNLIPPKYRKSLGEARFYNAVNDTYIDPDTGSNYVFPNPYIAGAPSEHIYRNDETKPTIEGIRNAVTDPGTGMGQLFGAIADVAYDADDNDALASSADSDEKNDSLKYEHSFFYIKLHIFNGDYGFDLFSHASQTDAMTIQMRSGSCDGCKFKVQAVKFTDPDGLETFKNPILVRDGVAVGLLRGDGIKESDLDPTQQNTMTHSIWICVQKDTSTFGHIYPSQEQNIKPQAGDLFNITNIDMPLAYWYDAEKRLEDDGLRFMADNNEEKFTFDIQASRIFLAEHPEVLAELDEYSKIKVKYDGKEYEQYVNQLTIECKDNEALPNIGIDLTDTLAVGQSFVDNVAERAASLVANAAALGGGAGGGMNAALAEMRYLNKQKADRTPYPLSVGGTFTAESGARFGDFVQGMMTGRGGAIDGAGNAEVESITVRSAMKVMELIYNRLNAQEGDTSFADSGTIDLIFTLDDGSRVAQLRRRWDGDFTAFQPGDIIYGYVNDLDRADKKEYYKAWAWIKSVDRANNQITIAEYLGSEVPAGVNHPMTEGMMISRWGNVIEPNMQTFTNPEYTAVIGKRSNGTYYNKRQRTFYISSEDGNLVELMGANKPILEKGNYGTILGVIPDGLLDAATEELINKDQPYLFARGIIVQDLIRIGYEGVKTRTSNYRGEWNAQTAASDKDYYRSTADMYDTVTYKGSLWQCVVSKNTAPPSDLNASWVKMTSGEDDGKELKIWTINPSTNIVSVRADGVEPEILSATVTLNSSHRPPTQFTDNIALYDEGAALYFSADGVTWKRFTLGMTEPLDLEDGSGVIEMEDSVDDSHILTVGGDDIDTDTIGDRIYFELRSVENGAVLAKTDVSVVKDGADGEDGEDGISIYVTPENILFKHGKSQTYIAFIDMYVGNIRIPASDMAINGIVSGGTVTDGLKIWYGVDDGRLDLRVVYNGTTDVDIDIPFTIVYKGIEYPRTIHVRTLADGEPGRDGLMVYPAGNYDPNVKYSATQDTMPVVMYNGNYYRLRAGAEYLGSDPTETYKNPADVWANEPKATARWILFDKFDSIFANIVMAEFAKLGMAVFYGEWMISQKGIDNNGASSNNYQDFKNGTFTPNLSLNFLDGQIRAYDGIFKGHIEADSGSFKGHIEADSGTFAGGIISRFKDITESDATHAQDSLIYTLVNDLKVIASGYTVILPVDLSYAGARAMICNDIKVYTRVDTTTKIKVQGGGKIYGLKGASTTAAPDSGAYSTAQITFYTGIVELVAVPSDDKCDWYVVGNNTYYSEY